MSWTHYQGWGVGTLTQQDSWRISTVNRDLKQSNWPAITILLNSGRMGVQLHCRGALCSKLSRLFCMFLSLNIIGQLLIKPSLDMIKQQDKSTVYVLCHLWKQKMLSGMNHSLWFNREKTMMSMDGNNTKARFVVVYLLMSCDNQHHPAVGNLSVWC